MSFLMSGFRTDGLQEATKIMGLLVIIAMANTGLIFESRVGPTGKEDHLVSPFHFAEQSLACSPHVITRLKFWRPPGHNLIVKEEKCRGMEKRLLYSRNSVIPAATRDHMHTARCRFG
jgi:hypothetical protein